MTSVSEEPTIQTTALRTVKARPMLFRPGAAVSTITLVVCTILVGIPLVALITTSFRTGSPGNPDSTFTLDNWAALGTPRLLQGIGNTLMISLFSTIGAVLLGVFFAWLLARTNVAWRGTLQVLIIVPMLVSPFLSTIAWVALAGPQAGFINVAWRAVTGLDTPLIDAYTFPVMIMLMILHYTPYVFLLVYGALSMVDSNLEDAARTHGASATYASFRVALPLISPSLVSAAILVFVLSSENFAIPTMLGASSRNYTLQYFLFSSVSEYPSNPGLAAVLGSLLLFVAVGGVMIQQWMSRYSKRFVTVTGKSVRQKRIDLKRWRAPAALACIVYVFLAVALPIGVLILASFLKYVSPTLSADMFTLDNYRAVFEQPGISRSMQNSLVFSVVGATLAVVFCMVLSFQVVRGRTRTTRAVEIVSSIPLAIPGLALGLGMLWGWIYLPIGIYGTIWVLLIAYLTRFMSFGVRIFSSGLTQVDPELEEAGRVSGLSTAQVMRRITMPILRPAVAAAWTLLFIEILLELPVTIMLYTGATQTLPVNIWHFAYGQQIAPAYAMASILAVIGTIVIIVSQRLFGTLKFLGSGPNDG